MVRGLPIEIFVDQDADSIMRRSLALDASSCDYVLETLCLGVEIVFCAGL